MYSDYKKRLLYKQKASSEEGHDINVSVWATRWTYPGAQHSTTGRARISTITNFNITPEVAVGTIETWRESGWILVEEFMDCESPAHCSDDIENACLKMLEAFLMGVNFEYASDGDDSEPPFSMGPGKNKSSKSSKIPIKASEGFNHIPSDDIKSAEEGNDEDDDDDGWL
jgi:hypothetical protein